MHLLHESASRRCHEHAHPCIGARDGSDGGALKVSRCIEPVPLPWVLKARGEHQRQPVLGAGPREVEHRGVVRTHAPLWRIRSDRHCAAPRYLTQGPLPPRPTGMNCGYDPQQFGVRLER